MKHRLAALLLFVLLAACSSDSATTSSGGQTDPKKLPSGSRPPTGVAPSVTASRVVIEVDYQSGAEPYTGSTVPFGETWKLFRTNAEKLFEKTKKPIEVPTTLDGMQKLDDIQGKQFSTDAILAIADRHWDGKDAADVVAYYVVWLDGYLEENGAPNQQVLGVSIGHTGVLAMFKPVIESSGLPLVPNLSRVVEQTVLVHEFGHAVGLVENGIPATSAHQDKEHGAHCTNEKCVMYWQVEGVAAARDYAQRNVTRSDLVLFADDCLADVTAASQ